MFAMLVCLLYVNCIDLFQSPENPGMPIVVITFDDAHPSVYAYSFPTMRSIDSTWGATHFFRHLLPRPPAGTITVAQAQEMEAHGWETGGHGPGYTHENLSASVPIDSVENQVQMDYDFLVANNLSHEVLLTLSAITIPMWRRW